MKIKQIFSKQIQILLKSYRKVHKQNQYLEDNIKYYCNQIKDLRIEIAFCKEINIYYWK